MRSLRVMRRGVLVAWSAMFALVLGTVVLSHVIGLTGHQPFIIRGRSMEPTIPLGSIVAIRAVDPAALRAGDVITLQDGPRPVFTHRIVRVEHAPDGSLQFITRGDANTQDDAKPVPVGAVKGRVEGSVPWLGFLLALLSMPTGMTSVLCGMASILCAVMLLEEDDRETQAVGATGPMTGAGDAPGPGHPAPAAEGPVAGQAAAEQAWLPDPRSMAGPPSPA